MLVGVVCGVFGTGAYVVVQICNEGGWVWTGIGGEVCHLEHGVLGSFMCCKRDAIPENPEYVQVGQRGEPCGVRHGDDVGGAHSDHALTVDVLASSAGFGLGCGLAGCLAQ